MATTGSSASTAPLHCSGEVEGLKTHISTALGGLLGRALNDLLEGGPNPGIDQWKQDSQTSCLPAPSSSGSPSTVRPGPVYDTELAERVRRLISKPCSVGLALLRAQAEADDELDSQPYTCFYCKGRFEQQSTLNRHMGRAHRTEMVCSELKRTESAGDPGVASGGGGCDPKSQPPDPECPGGSDRCRIKSGVGVARATVSPPETSAVSPRTSVRPHSRKLSAGKDVPAAHVTEGYQASGTPPDSGTRGCVGEAQGLKTHMSAALGGLLDRALSSRLVGDGSPGGTASARILDQPKLALLRKQVAHKSFSGSSTPGHRGPVYAADLSRQLRRRLFSKSRPRGTALVRSTTDVDSLSNLQPFACFYCESRFEQQSARNWHVRHGHASEAGSSVWKRARTERGPGGADSSQVRHGRAAASGRQLSAERRAVAAPCELDASWRACRGAARAECGARLTVSASEAGGQFHADPLGMSRCDDVVKEEPVLSCELNAAERTIDAWDPVSIKREVHEDPEEISEFSGSIKEDPELDLGVDANDSDYRPSQCSCRRGEACRAAATIHT